MSVFDGHENPDQGSGGTYCSMLHFFGTQSPRVSSCTGTVGNTFWYRDVAGSRLGVPVPSIVCEYYKYGLFWPVVWL